MTEPTEHECHELLMSMEPSANEHAAVLKFVRAVLARWGTPPAVAGEPVAFLVCTEEGDPDMVFLNRHEAQQYLEDHEQPIPLYPTPQPAQAADSVLEDAARLDWLEQNIFHREMDEWDSKVGGRGNQSMWVLFAPKGVQGSARKIIDAARKQGGQHGAE